MFDDRLEIESPGRLPGMVTVENIKETRYSRNPRIARVLTEFGWVRELNEGVKRIYADMEKFFLDDPEYSEPGSSVRLVLRNNIVMRNLRKKDWTVESIGDDTWATLGDVEHKILVFMSEKKAVTRQELQNHLNRSGAFVTKRLSNLIDMGIVKPNGHTNDPKRTYSIVYRQ
jgi:ATP-dependent DNA helicase RecG